MAQPRESGSTQSRCSGLSTAPQYAPASGALEIEIRYAADGDGLEILWPQCCRRQRLRLAKINLHSHGLNRSPPCVCGRDVIEVTHGLAALASKGLLWL
jgi:hypothetical protein